MDRDRRSVPGNYVVLPSPQKLTVPTAKIFWLELLLGLAHSAKLKV